MVKRYGSKQGPYSHYIGEVADGDYVLYTDYAALQAKADRLARLLQNFTIFDWRMELKGSQFHPEDVDRIELDAMEAAAALADYRTTTQGEG